MSYFDHVRCHSCKSMLDPERLATEPGQGASCPYCRAPLSLKDLFGVADAFAEEDAPDVTLDDLLRPIPDGQPTSAPPPRSAPRPEAKARSARPTTPEARRIPDRSASATGALVRRETRDDDDDTPSALDLMRSMKKRR